MLTLIKFEFIKLYKKKMNLIIFWGTCAMMAFFMFLSVFQTWTYNKEGNRVEGYDYIKYKKEVIQELSGPLTDERVKEIIKEYQKLASTPGNAEGSGEDWHFVESVYYKYYLVRSELLLLIGHNYDEPGVQTWGANLRELPVNEADGFYAVRSKRLQDTLTIGSSDWQYTGQERDYWLKESEQIKTPFTYGYAEGWQRWIDVLAMFSIPMVSLFIMVAQVYAGEYESSAENIILTTKYGKTKVITAKNIAAFLYGGLFYTLNLATGLFIILGSFGTEGGNLPIQVYESQIPYALTHVEAVVICTGILYLIAFGMIAVTLWLSARMKSGLPVLAVMLFLFFIALFLKASDTNGIYNHILYLLPFNAADHGLRMILSYPFGDFVLNYVNMRYILYLLLTALVTPFAGRAFKKHQVQ